ncbi:MAG: sensor histidine kinase [Bacteroidota bacterium]
MKDKQNIEFIKEMKDRLDAFHNAMEERELLQKQLQEVNRKLQDAEAFKSHFIARISNEFINPFTAILTISDNLRKGKFSDQKELQKMIGYVYDEAMFLDFQLKNLFTAAKIEAGEIERDIETVYPAKLINEVLKEYDKEMEKKKLQLEKTFGFPQNSVFITDKGKLELIVKNLLSNAIKFSDRESKVTLESRLTDGKLFFEVENQGTPITEEQLEVIFDRFRQLDNRIHSLNPGSGIGLSICRELAELLNGEIHAVRTNNGIRFMVTLPEMQTDMVESDDNKIFFKNGDTESGDTL